MEKKQAVILVTGASSGFGNACATYLSKRGFRVYGTSRDPSKYQKKADEFFEMLRMDVTDEASVKAAIDQIVQREGRIDGLLSNAGTGIAGSIEDTSIEEAKHQLDVNFFGTLRVVRAVLPVMRKQGAGHIVCIGSIAGRIGLPYQGLYSTSKFAIEGLVESLRVEVRKFGIKACVIEPGDFETGFTAARQMAKAAGQASAYREHCEQYMSIYVHDETNGAKPIQLAKLAYKIFLTKEPRVRYSVGAFMQRLSLFVKRFVGSKFFERLFRSFYKD